MITVIDYDSRHRDDMIFMVLSAKDALGRIPRLNDDLLDVDAHYHAVGGAFWLAIDENNRVVGSLGCNTTDTGDAILHRLYIKPQYKRQGIGSLLLAYAEDFACSHHCKRIVIHLGDPAIYWESRLFYLNHGYAYTDSDHMIKAIHLLST